MLCVVCCDLCVVCSHNGKKKVLCRNSTKRTLEGKLTPVLERLKAESWMCIPKDLLEFDINGRFRTTIQIKDENEKSSSSFCTIQ